MSFSLHFPKLILDSLFGFSKTPWDLSISTESAQLEDYKYSGYDRGHLIPATDMRWSAKAMDDSFFMSNMSPQVGGFNGGIWKRLENRVRKWAEEYEEIYIVVGPVLTDGPYETIGDNEVSVPKRFYKVIIDFTEPEYKAIGFIMVNESNSADIMDFAVSINEVEEVTGIDFFYLLPDDIEEEIESNIDIELWEFE